jgi:hypothetical protein
MEPNPLAFWYVKDNLGQERKWKSTHKAAANRKEYVNKR